MSCPGLSPLARFRKAMSLAPKPTAPYRHRLSRGRPLTTGPFRHTHFSQVGDESVLNARQPIGLDRPGLGTRLAGQPECVGDDLDAELDEAGIVDVRSLPRCAASALVGAGDARHRVD